MTRITQFTSLIIIALALLSCQNELTPSVVIAIDDSTYRNSKAEVDRYVESMSLDDRKGMLLVDKWTKPEQIKAELIKLYKTENLEGVVFIGEIPIPMIRDAQHLTTAFKMRQNRDWKDSSVPSDRYYDDFDLEFDYLKQDSVTPLYHYYSLTTESEQKIQSEIYSARIKPSKDQSLSEYLSKVVKEKEQRKKMNHILYFAGHGYNSESINARIDEAYALRNHFPFLANRVGAKLDFIDCTTDDFIKDRLLAAIADKDLDLAVLHHHGSDDGQILNGVPHTSNTKYWIDFSKNFFRSKIRNSKDPKSSIEYYKKNYSVPYSWLTNAFDPILVKEDSIFSANMDIDISELKNYKAGAKIILFDACFNGSFHLDQCIASRYAFNKGNTIVVKANSVNSLQDIWLYESIGLLNYGVSVGNWAKNQFTLESHLIGDPTFCFSPEKESSLSTDIVKYKDDAKYWKKLLTNQDPELRAVAIKFLFNNNAITSDQLLDIQKTDNSNIVRLQAFTILKQIADKNLIPAIIWGLNDNYELLQRLAANTAARNSSPELLETILDSYTNPTTSRRVKFQLNSALFQFDANLVKEALLERSKKDSYMWPTEEDLKDQIIRLMARAKGDKEDFEKLNISETPERYKSFTINAQKNKNNVLYLNSIFKFIGNTENDLALRISAVETLGWYNYSYKRDEIIAFLKTQLEVNKESLVNNELLKTIKRLES